MLIYEVVWIVLVAILFTLITYAKQLFVKNLLNAPATNWGVSWTVNIWLRPIMLHFLEACNYFLTCSQFHYFSILSRSSTTVWWMQKLNLSVSDCSSTDLLSPHIPPLRTSQYLTNLLYPSVKLTTQPLQLIVCVMMRGLCALHPAGGAVDIEVAPSVWPLILPLDAAVSAQSSSSCSH